VSIETFLPFKRWITESVPYAENIVYVLVLQGSIDNFQVRSQIFKCYMQNLQFIHDFVYEKLLTSLSWFLTELFKSRIVDVFWNTVYNPFVTGRHRLCSHMGDNEQMGKIMTTQ